MNLIRIGDREVGPGRPAFVIAEAGVNHNGSADLAHRLIDVAIGAGCDAVKFQKRSVRALLSREAFNKPYSNQGHTFGSTYGEHRQRVELSPEQWVSMKAHADEAGIMLLGSAWDEQSAAFVESLGVPAHKIGSPDLTNLPLCRQLASFGKPVILSTGMSRAKEVDVAVANIRNVNSQLIVLHCVSAYPAAFEDLRLGCIPQLRGRYQLPVGYSGHEHGWHAVIAAVALGACVIEKHITLDRSMKGGDHRLSLEPDDLRAMVRQIRDVEVALPGSSKELLPAETKFREKLGKSVVTKVDVPKGTRLTEDMLGCKSPATGISPMALDRVVGRVAVRDLGADLVLQWDDVREVKPGLVEEAGQACRS